MLLNSLCRRRQWRRARTLDRPRPQPTPETWCLYSLSVPHPCLVPSLSSVLPITIIPPSPRTSPRTHLPDISISSSLLDPLAHSDATTPSATHHFPSPIYTYTSQTPSASPLPRTMPTPMQMVPPRRPKNSMAELRLRRLNEHNQRLKEDLVRPRIRVSEASHRWVEMWKRRDREACSRCSCRWRRCPR